MISAWWLLPAFVIGGAAVFLLYDLWGLKLLDRLAARDAAQRAADHKNYRLKQALVKLQRIWPDMTAEEAGMLATLNQLSGSEFESLIGRLYERMGYTVQLVGGSGDHGIDLIARNGNDAIAVQCKRYGMVSPIANHALRDLLGAVHPHQPCRAALVTTSYLSRKAEEFLKRAPLEVYCGRDTVRLLLEHGMLPEINIAATPATRGETA